MRNIHLSEAIWGHDATEFRPERWEGAMEGGLPKGVPQGAYIVSQPGLMNGSIGSPPCWTNQQTDGGQKRLK